MTQIVRMAGSIWQPAPLTNLVNISAVLVAGHSKATIPNRQRSLKPLCPFIDITLCCVQLLSQC